jgi:phenylacetate-coenzyme A ligase PaaK-like adenylate-forming protein
MNADSSAAKASRARRGAEPRSRIESPPAPSIPFVDPLYAAHAGWETWLGGRLPAEEIAARRDARLRATIEFARAHSPYYRRLYRDLPPVGAVALDRLPIVHKRALMKHFDEVVTDPAVTRARVMRFVADPRRIGRPFLGRYAVWSSSGTLGEPGYFVHDGHALAVYDALELLRLRAANAAAAAAAAWVPTQRYALVAAIDGHFAGIATLRRLVLLYPWLAPTTRAFSLLQPLARLVAELNDYQPALLATYPTAAEMLADEQAAGRLRLALRELWTGGECLPPPVRARLARVFGCTVRSGYGASEFLSIGWECTHGRLHLNADWVVLEPVDARLRPVPPGVPSHTVLLTNLVNRVQPLIRYALGDSVTLDRDACPCGCALPSMTVEGRHDDVLVYPRADGTAVRLLPLVLCTVMEDEAGVHDFQLVQSDAGVLGVRLGGGERGCRARVQHALRAHLDALGLGHVRVSIEHAGPQRDPVSGKLRRVQVLRAHA